MASSRLAYPEGRAALAMARRLGRLTGGYAAALAAFEDVIRQVYTIEVDESLARRAGDLAELHGLPGYDAIHLASALALEETAPVLVSWDAELARAAGSAGLAVAPPPA